MVNKVSSGGNEKKFVLKHCKKGGVQSSTVTSFSHEITVPHKSDTSKRILWVPISSVKLTWLPEPVKSKTPSLSISTAWLYIKVDPRLQSVVASTSKIGEL